FCLERILYEMRASRYQALSPVNGLLSCLAIHASDPHHPELARCIAGLEAWRWEDEDKGIRYAGARSNAWDTAFVLRAALEAPEPWRQRQPMLEGYGFLRNTQMKEELEGRERERRDPVLGGFCFSDGAHRWPVSDCTAEALSAILEMHADPALAPSSALRIADGLIQKAITFVLARQNQDGGFGTYERRRAGSFLEALNPSEMFGQCMTERSYVECTASCVSALARARTARTEEGSPLLSRAIMGKVESSIRRAIHFLGSQQRPDGSWAGFWGIHFTYAIFHVVEAFHAAGRRSADPTLRRAVKWLLSKQKADGGWGEHYTSAMTGHYVEHSESQASNTAWALLALLGAGEAPASAPVMRAVRWLGSKQLPDGSWPTQAPAGVFFGTAVLDYTLYKNYFPTWALARHTKLCERP
ncbi:MAG TPA: prenyltransferase/squalene oxidase repeat-containing protein, partial [Polyangiaceae bacterium]